MPKLYIALLQFNSKMMSNWCLLQNKCDVASLVERYLGALYPNFPRVRPVLVRQARDILVCTYHGNLMRFEREFCVPAAELLQGVKDVASRKVCKKIFIYSTYISSLNLREKILYNSEVILVQRCSRLVGSCNSPNVLKILLFHHKMNCNS